MPTVEITEPGGIKDLGPAGIPSMAITLSSAVNDGPDRTRGNSNYQERSAPRGPSNTEIPLPDSNLDLDSKPACFQP
jgi:hypothetical protein